MLKDKRATVWEEDENESGVFKKGILSFWKSAQNSLLHKRTITYQEKKGLPELSITWAGIA
jgi:hypothetical protein